MLRYIFWNISVLLPQPSVTSAHWYESIVYITQERKERRKVVGNPFIGDLAKLSNESGPLKFLEVMESDDLGLPTTG